MRLTIDFATPAELSEQLAQLGYIVRQDIAPAVVAAGEAKLQEVKTPVPAEPKDDPEPTPENAVGDTAEGEENTRNMFSELVSEDYDKALAMLEELDCESFMDCVEQGKVTELRTLLEKQAA